MVWFRSLIFAALFYLWSLLLSIIGTPLLLGPRAWTLGIMHLWAKSTVFLLRIICQIRLEFRGLEHLRTSAGLVAMKHQCMFDTIAPILLQVDMAFVMKRELLSIPFFGWFASKAQMIAVDRDGQASALRHLVADARRAVSVGRPIFIFPEGTRTAPGQTGQYKSGVAALYRDLDIACTPIATNSGQHWPAHGFLRRPGVIVYECLEPIPPKLHRAAFMRMLQDQIEAASLALLAE